MSTKDQRAISSDSPNKNYLPLVFMLVLSLVLTLGAVHAFASDRQGGGFSGPGPDPGGFTGSGPNMATVEQVKGMRDDAKVTLQGKIIQRLGGKYYVFQDATGTIEVEIADKRWQGQNVGPDDLVEIYGEVEREWSQAKIEVKRLIKR